MNESNLFYEEEITNITFRTIRTEEYREILELINGNLKVHNVTSAGFGFGIK